MDERRLREDFPFIRRYNKLTDVLTDHDLASLGDAYVNFIYSLALSKIDCRPIGRKLNSLVLASAIRMAGMRRFLSPRTDRHRQADAAEALIVYGWLSGALSLEEMVDVLTCKRDVAENLSILLKVIVEKTGLA